MYNEKSFQNYIFWTKVRRIFLILLFSVIGCLLGIFISDIINTVTINDSYRTIIISISTLSFFALSLLLTIGTAREVQDGYWKIAVLRKLTAMSKKLDNLGELENFKEELNDLEIEKTNIIETTENIQKDIENNKEISLELKNEEIYNEENNSTEVKNPKRTLSICKTM